jgi:hypothetical protein
MSETADDQIGVSIKEMFPDLSPEELALADEALASYVEAVLAIFVRTQSQDGFTR